MEGIDAIHIGISVSLGRARLPIRQLRKMGRGALILLDRSDEAPSRLIAEGQAIAEGDVVLKGEQIGLTVHRLLGTTRGAAR